MKTQRSGYLGDNLNDLAVRSSVELLLAPQNAYGPLHRQADAVLRQRGGYTAVHELAERILNAKKPGTKCGAEDRAIAMTDSSLQRIFLSSWSRRLQSASPSSGPGGVP